MRPQAKAIYISVHAQRNAGNNTVNRIVKVMDGVNLFVDIKRGYIGMTKGVYGAPASFSPTTKKAFDKAYNDVMKEINQLKDAK